MTRPSIIMLLGWPLLLTGCSDPIDDEPVGQTIPTHAELRTSFAAGSGPGAPGGSGGPSANGAPPEGGPQDGAMSGGAPQGGTPAMAIPSPARGGGSAVTDGALPAAGLQSGSGQSPAGAGRSSGSGQGGASGVSGGGR